MLLTVSANKKNRIFLATADSVVQAWFPETQRELIRQIKLFTLLGYEVVFGAPFVWQSKETRHAVEVFSPLIDSGLVGLMGRPGIESATGYLDERRSDTRSIASLGLPADSAFSTEVPSPEALGFAKTIDSISPLIQRRGSIEGNFKEFFTCDLGFGASTGSLDQRIRDELGTKYSEVSWRKAEALSNELRDLQGLSHFSRATVEAAIINKDLPIELISTTGNPPALLGDPKSLTVPGI